MAKTSWLIASFGESQPGPSSPAPEGAELRTALSVLLLTSLDELLHARQPLLVLHDLLTGLALPRLTLGVGRLRLLLESLHFLLHLREEFSINLRPSHDWSGEHEPDGRSEDARSKTRSHWHLLSESVGRPPDSTLLEGQECPDHSSG